MLVWRTEVLDLEEVSYLFLSLLYLRGYVREVVTDVIHIMSKLGLLLCYRLVTFENMRPSYSKGPIDIW